MTYLNYQKDSICEFIYNNTDIAWFWLIVRVYVGYAWLTSGIGKVTDSAWVGDNAGAAVSGFLNGALQKMEGPHPDVQVWYGWFIENIALPNAEIFSHLVAFGEVLVGAALILGLFTAIASFFGSLMNTSFLLAGTVSTNPILLILSIFLMLAWRIAGYYGFDRYVLRRTKSPWRFWRIFRK